MTQSIEDTDLWIRRFHPRPDAAVRLVCFPHAGGSASFYFPVSKALESVADVLAVQYPGRQDRLTEPCFDTVEAMADAVTEALMPWTDRPLALFGHSMGASLAYEVAYRLEARSVMPVALFASGRRAPSTHRDETVHLRDDDGLIAEIRALSGTNSQVLQDEEVLRMVMPAIRNDYKAAETYRWRPTDPIQAPIHVHIGEDDPKVDANEARAWERHTSGRFSLTSHPGGHFYLNARAAQVIAARLSQELRAVSR